MSRTISTLFLVACAALVVNALAFAALHYSAVVAGVPGWYVPLVGLTSFAEGLVFCWVGLTFRRNGL